MSPNLEPLLVPKTGTSFSQWLQQFRARGMPKTCSQNWHRCWHPKRDHRLAFGCNNLLPNLMPFISILRRRANRNRSDYHDGREMVSVYAQTHERLPLYQCASDGLAQRSFLSRAESARIACLGMPPMGQNRPPNTRASQIFLVRYIQMPQLGPTGCAWGVV